MAPIRSPVPVPLAEPPEQPAEAHGQRLLQPGGGRGHGRLLLLLGLVGVLDDGVAVEGGAVVHLQDGAELVRVDQVDDGDGHADQEADQA